MKTPLVTGRRTAKTAKGAEFSMSRLNHKGGKKMAVVGVRLDKTPGKTARYLFFVKGLSRKERVAARDFVHKLLDRSAKPLVDLSLRDLQSNVRRAA